MDEGVKSKLAAADFDKALTAGCASQEAALKTAIIAQQLSMKAPRQDAEKAAAEWLTDLKSNAHENYVATIGEPAKPAT